jgi:hypothetical protein
VKPLDNTTTAAAVLLVDRSVRELDEDGTPTAEDYPAGNEVVLLKKWLCAQIPVSRNDCRLQIRSARAS